MNDGLGAPLFAGPKPRGLRLKGRQKEYEGSWYGIAQGAEYNAASQITRWQESGAFQGGWNTLSRSYDANRGWVTGITVTDVLYGTVMNLTYSYLENGRLAWLKDTANPTLSAVYEYDNLNRLSRTTAGTMTTNGQIATVNWALQWSYDEFGNRLSQAKVPGSPGTPPENTLSYDEGGGWRTLAPVGRIEE